MVIQPEEVIPLLRSLLPCSIEGNQEVQISIEPAEQRLTVDPSCAGSRSLCGPSGSLIDGDLLLVVSLGCCCHLLASGFEVGNGSTGVGRRLRPTFVGAILGAQRGERKLTMLTQAILGMPKLVSFNQHKRD